ncbi:DUF4259 domain-containing protein [Actinotalea sp. C106]|uniref:DUF4259 domain-containing protein n=1 Tax=Actinotalea sp. C106 TaxID=2908644 RepID=UPI0020277840|nr:DUF4259 domain-containing protein [Actinotalea sp. C106]
MNPGNPSIAEVLDADAASDLLAELADRAPRRRPALLRRVLAHAVQNKGYLEADDAAAAMAAAALVAVARDMTEAEGDEDLEALTAFPVDARLLESALAALGRLADPRDNELLGSWEDGEALDGYLAGIHRWHEALSRPVTGRPPARRRARTHGPRLRAGATFLCKLPSGRRVRAVVIAVRDGGESARVALVGPATLDPDDVGAQSWVLIDTLDCLSADLECREGWSRRDDAPPPLLRTLQEEPSAEGAKGGPDLLGPHVLDALVDDTEARGLTGLAWHHDPRGIAPWREDLVDEYAPWVETTQEAARAGEPAAGIAALLAVRYGDVGVHDSALRRYAEDAYAYLESWRPDPE